MSTVWEVINKKFSKKTYNQYGENSVRKYCGEYSVRKYIKTVWGIFSEKTLWAIFSEKMYINSIGNIQ